MRKTGLAVAVMAAVVVGAGCSTLGQAVFKQPVVNLQSVAIRGVGLTGGSLDVKLSVYNPNRFKLDGTKLNYKVNLAGDSITMASGTISNQFSVGQGDSSLVTIPVDFTYAGIGAAARSILNTGTIAYHVLGDVAVGSPVGNFTVPFSSTGRFTTTGVAR
jgi:LEA14-like dessication related protein